MHTSAFSRVGLSPVMRAATATATCRGSCLSVFLASKFTFAHRVEEVCLTLLMRRRSDAAGDDAHSYLDKAFACAEKGPIQAMRYIREALRRCSNNAGVLIRAAEAMIVAGYPDKAARVAQAAEQRITNVDERYMLERLQQRMHAPESAAVRCPTELLVRIFSYLDTPALASSMLVCKTWRLCIIHVPQLWQDSHICTPSGDTRRKIQLQSARLSLILDRTRSRIRRLGLAPPLSNAPAARALLAPCSAHLASLHITCLPENAGAWIKWATASNISALSIESTESRSGTHAWLLPPIKLKSETLRSLRLVGAPPLDTDTDTLATVARLHTLVYATGPSYGGARAARTRHANALVQIIRAAAPSLRELELDGEAIWALDFFAPGISNVPFPQLARLKAPLRSVAPSATGTQCLFPALQELETQISASRAPGTSPTALLSLARTTRGLHTLRIRGLADTPTWLADSLLRIWKDVNVLAFCADEEVYSAAMAHETRGAFLARPLCSTALVRLLVPTARPDGSVDALLPRLGSLAFGPDVLLRGPELIELVRERSKVEMPISSVDVDLCLSLDLAALPILSECTGVRWDGNSHARAQVRARRARMVG